MTQMFNSPSSRLHTLDYLRGLAALLIMIYHYLTWSYGHFSSSSTLGRVGIYGVAIFYVLSGLTLYHVYFKGWKNEKQDFIEFYIKRFFRIFPLLWLAIILTLIVKRNVPDLGNFILNTTGLFSLFAWDDAIPTGAWSIGNELCFYFIFPALVLARKKMPGLFIVIGLVIFSFFLYFAFFKLSEHHSLEAAWSIYTNPLNQAFLFFGGFLIGVVFENKIIRIEYLAAVLSVALLLFIFLPVTGDTISLTTGYNRLLLTFSCFLICGCFYKFTLPLNKHLHILFQNLGHYSFSLYLLHPIIWYAFRYLFKATEKLSGNQIPFAFQVIACIFCSLVVSKLVYLKYEKVFIALGKQIQNRFLTGPASDVEN